MAYSVTFTMQAQYTGTTEADNFTIVGKHANGSPADTTIATGVSKANLIAGVTYQVADTITGGTVTSTGTCTNSVNWTGQSSGGILMNQKVQITHTYSHSVEKEIQVTELIMYMFHKLLMKRLVVVVQ